MKKLLLLLIPLLVACDNTSNESNKQKLTPMDLPAGYEGFELSPLGSWYKYHIHGTGRQAKYNERIHAEVIKRVGNMLISVDNYIIGRAGISLVLSPNYGDYRGFFEALKIGDSITILQPLDSIIAQKENNLSIDIQAKVYEITLKVLDIYTPEEAQKYENINTDSLMAKYLEEQVAQESEIRKQKQLVEDEKFAQYIKKHNLKDPNEDGIYTLAYSKGNGAVVKKGNRIYIDYTASLIDGTIFESTIEYIAAKAGIVFPQREYKPLEIVVGNNEFIPTVEKYLIGLNIGTTVKLLLPSLAAFGETGDGSGVDSFEPIIIEVTINKKQ